MQLKDKVLAGGRRNIPAVHKAVDIYLGQPALFGKLQQTEQMFDVAVNAAVRQQSHQMQGRVVFAAVFNRTGQRLVGKKLAVLDGFGDAGQLLINNSARADVGVSNLGVAHLPIGKSDVQTGSTQLGVWVGGKISVQIRLFSSMNGVAVISRVDAESV